MVIENRITSAITCFEALYLKGKEREELSHRLCQRAAALLRLMDFTPLEVYNKLNQAYDIRSTFIHGSQSEFEHQKAQDLCKTVLEYARISLLIFFQLKEAINKEELINKLDNSLLDDRALIKIKELIGDNIIITK